MGKELASLYPVAQQTFDEADDALGYKLSQLCFEGPEERLKLTEITQPAILTVSTAAWRVLQSKGIVPTYVAGHSLGEYSAQVAAGTLSFSDAVPTVGKPNPWRARSSARPRSPGSGAPNTGVCTLSYPDGNAARPSALGWRSVL